jgi:hypothetical protein
VAEALPEVSAQETIMTVSLWTDRIDASSVADRALTLAARLWFLTAVAGQLMFAAYVVGFYGGSAVRGDMAAWNRVMPRGHVPGDSMGNFVVALHLLLAVVIILGDRCNSSPGCAAARRAFIDGMAACTSWPCSRSALQRSA